MQTPDPSSQFPQVSACQHPFPQSYFSSCLLLRTLGSKPTALVLTCHRNQQCCNKWVGLSAQSCAQLGWGPGLLSAREGDSREQGWVRPRSCHGCTVTGSSGGTAGTPLCLGPSQGRADGRGGTTSARHPTDALPSPGSGQGPGPSTSLPNQAPQTLPLLLRAGMEAEPGNKKDMPGKCSVANTASVVLQLPACSVWVFVRMCVMPWAGRGQGCAS